MYLHIIVLQWKKDDFGRAENFSWDDAEPALCDELAGRSPGKRLNMSKILHVNYFIIYSADFFY